MTFWEHLDELRGSLIRMAVAVVACAIVAFLFKEELFGIILAPHDEGFITYRLLDKINQALGATPLTAMGDMDVQLINTGLAHQFLLHVRASLYAGVLVTSPYLIYQLFRFVSPALYTHERRHAIRIVGWSYLLFMLGILVSYLLIFPLVFRFLGTYQVSTAVANTVTIESYMSSLMSITLAMGILFEIPVLCWILGRMGIINASLMKRYRRHVIVALLIVAAIITPTSDVFTLTLVALPMWLLYETGILIVKKTKNDDNVNDDDNDNQLGRHTLPHTLNIQR